VVPHAGPMYSGTVAAAVYRCLQADRPSRVVILGFSHHGGPPGVAVPRVESIATPLGDAALDTDFMRRLAEQPPFSAVPEEFVCDHSAEIQIPFLQRAVPGAMIVPLYVGRLDARQRDRAAETLAAAWEPGTAWLASSDLTHYGRNFGYQPFPLDADTPWRLQDLDSESISAAGSLDAALFEESLRQSGDTVCGAAPIALMLEALRRLDGNLYQESLDYQTSGEITGDYSHSVSYGALGYYPAAAFELGPADRQALLASAGATLAALRETGQRRPMAASKGSPALEAVRGVFVTLHQGDRLLGCIGQKEGRAPLREAVPELTISAALDDPRFEHANKVPGPIDIEISVLGPVKRIRGPQSFEVGRHGAFLESGGCRGLLLPQVADGRGWDAEDFLRAVARKSCLGSDAWRQPGARLYCFEAQVFS
jgi:MEMO1 family protein